MTARFAKLAAVMAETFGVEPSKIAPETTPDDLRKWDSIGHMKLVAGLEEAFGVSFEVDEIMEMLSAAAIDDFLRKKGIADGA